eukprot:2302795-Ditylum_brightwellii.AAC.1
MTRAATKAGEFKDAEMKDNKTAPSTGKRKSDDQDECIGSGIGGSLDPLEIKNKKSLRVLVLTASGATSEAVETEGLESNIYKNGDPMKKCKVLPSPKDMEAIHDNQPTNEKTNNNTIDLTETESAGKADEPVNEGVNLDDDGVEVVKDSDSLSEDTRKAVTRAFNEILLQ